MFAVGSGILLLVVVGVAVSSLLPSTPDGPQLTYRVVLGDLDVTVTEPGTLESSENTEIRCKVRGRNTITSVVESGSIVKEGEELLRLDTLLIEEQIHERTKFAHWCKAGEVQLKAHMNRSELAVRAYLEGEFIERLTDLERFLAIGKVAIGKVVDGATAAGKWAGLGGVYDEAILPGFIEMGMRFILGGSDLSFILAGAKARGDFFAKLQP